MTLLRTIRLGQTKCSNCHHFLKTLTSNPTIFWKKCDYGHNLHFHTTTQIRKTYRERIKLRTEKVKTANADDMPSSVRIMMEQLKKNSPPISSSISGDGELTQDSLQTTLRSIQWDMNAIVSKAKQRAQHDSDHVVDHGTDGEKNAVEEDESVKRRIWRKRLDVSNETPDPSIPISDIPCSGCGANLHCQQTSLAGFMPSQKFKSSTIEELNTAFCERCSLIRKHNVHINVKLPEEEFPKLFKKIRTEKCLVLLVLDLLDVRNSIPKNIHKLIGEKKDLFIIGNKVDMIPKDGDGYLERVENELLRACINAGIKPHAKNIQGFLLVSGITGYGIETLVTKLMKYWELKGNVYLVGNMNAGKSTLFNALLRSDYCKFSARGGVKRATVSDWPGTTLSLLKFPIVRPEGWKLAKRTQRFLKQTDTYQEELDLRRSKAKEGNWKYASLAGIVSVTDFRDEKVVREETYDQDQYRGYDSPMFEYNTDDSVTLRGKGRIPDDRPKATYDPRRYQQSKWLCDTPGIINKESILTRLHPDELSAIIPQSIMMPRPFLLKPGDVLFITGLGRIDYIEGGSPVLVTTFVHSKLPVIDCTQDEADQIYRENIGTPYFKVPIGDEERLDKIPSLIGREFTVQKVDHHTAAADIQLSSLGWVSVTLSLCDEVRLRAYTPGGRGLYIRRPSLLPCTNVFRGTRIKGTRRYKKRHPLV